MRALVVDDHPVARSGVRALLQLGFRPEPVDVVEIERGDQAVQSARAHRPDVITLDLDLPGEPNSNTLCGLLHAAVPSARILIVTAFDRPTEIKRCLAAGANGCLLKDTRESDLVDGVRAVLRGETVMDPRIAQELATDMVGILQHGEEPVHLTPREREVLALLAEGCSNKAIADRLYLSEPTIKGHVRSLLEKLGAESRLQAVVGAIKRGLL
ncbi:MAG: response regulator transcription factor [Solirubrobacterales bacterium]|nr:response regulator transcription factor [Solirubrobacterales bacterium]